jgi:hypothetical protein
MDKRFYSENRQGVAKPGMMEYELEAEFNSGLAVHRQRRTALPSMIAGARNHSSDISGDAL